MPPKKPVPVNVDVGNVSRDLSSLIHEIDNKPKTKASGTKDKSKAKIKEATEELTESMTRLTSSPFFQTFRADLVHDMKTVFELRKLYTAVKELQLSDDASVPLVLDAAQHHLRSTLVALNPEFFKKAGEPGIEEDISVVNADTAEDETEKRFRESLLREAGKANATYTTTTDLEDDQELVAGQDEDEDQDEAGLVIDLEDEEDINDIYNDMDSDSDDGEDSGKSEGGGEDDMGEGGEEDDDGYAAGEDTQLSGVDSHNDSFGVI